MHIDFASKIACLKASEYSDSLKHNNKNKLTVVIGKVMEF